MEKSNVPYDTISRASVTSHSLISKCCCCIPLRIGCFILGYTALVITILQILALVAVTTFVGVASHGFDHLDEKPADLTDEDLAELEKPMLQSVGLILIFFLVAGLAWLAIVIACLVGLHKKRPGPIRVYVGFVTARLVISIAVFIYAMVYKPENIEPKFIISHCVDLGLTAYFILVYYVYSCQIERERREDLAQPNHIQNVYIYPTILDEKKLMA